MRLAIVTYIFFFVYLIVILSMITFSLQIAATKRRRSNSYLRRRGVRWLECQLSKRPEYGGVTATFSYFYFFWLVELGKVSAALEQKKILVGQLFLPQ